MSDITVIPALFTYMMSQKTQGAQSSFDSLEVALKANARPSKGCDYLLIYLVNICNH